MSNTNLLLYSNLLFIGCTPVSFGKFFVFFEKYWHLCEQREILYSTFDVFIRTEALYILPEWNKNGIRICGTLENYSGFDLP